MTAYYSIVYMYHIFLIWSVIDGHLDSFHVFAIVNSAARKIHVHESYSRKIYSFLCIYLAMGLLGQMVFLVLDT